PATPDVRSARSEAATARCLDDQLLPRGQVGCRGMAELLGGAVLAPYQVPARSAGFATRHTVRCRLPVAGEQADPHRLGEPEPSGQAVAAAPASPAAAAAAVGER